MPSRCSRLIPRTFNLDAGQLAEAIDALLTCAQACTACADACLAEDDVAAMVKCIRTNLDCADICETTMRVLSRQTEYDANITRAQREACAQACRSATNVKGTAMLGCSTMRRARRHAGAASRRVGS